LVVVDTSVWIDLFRGRETPQVAACTALIEEDAAVALTDVVLTELLQGVSTDSQAHVLESQLTAFPILRLQTLEDFSLAAGLYRASKRTGQAVRNTMDCLIAAPCIRTGAQLLHSDADFERLAACSSLQIYET
jgi:predicted nucleic acid-binding protein